MAQFHVDTTLAFLESCHGQLESYALRIYSFLYEASASVKFSDFPIDPLQMRLQFVLSVLDLFDTGIQVVVYSVELTPHTIGTDS